jgi:DNA-binding transcriptional ArsR family regulator
VFRGLADPTRLWFVEMLRDHDVGLLRFRGIFPLSASTVLHHLRILEESGLLCSRKQGPRRLYTLRLEGLIEAEARLRAIPALRAIR